MPDGKKYTIRHIEDNHAEKTKKIISYDLITAHTINADDFLKLPQMDSSEVLKNIQAISELIFLYHRHDQRGGYHYTKVISPDFFLHMSVSDKLNIDNPYFNKLGYDSNQLIVM